MNWQTLNYLVALDDYQTELKEQYAVYQLPVNPNLPTYDFKDLIQYVDNIEVQRHLRRVYDFDNTPKVTILAQTLTIYF